MVHDSRPDVPKAAGARARFERLFPGFLASYDPTGCAHCMENILVLWDGGGAFKPSGQWIPCSNYEAIFDCVERGPGERLVYHLVERPPDPKNCALQIQTEAGEGDVLFVCSEAEAGALCGVSDVLRAEFGPDEYEQLVDDITAAIAENRGAFVVDRLGCRPSSPLAPWQEAWLASLLGDDDWHQLLLSLHQCVTACRGERLRLVRP